MEMGGVKLSSSHRSGSSANARQRKMDAGAGASSLQEYGPEADLVRQYGGACVRRSVAYERRMSLCLLRTRQAALVADRQRYARRHRSSRQQVE